MSADIKKSKETPEDIRAYFDERMKALKFESGKDTAPFKTNPDEPMSQTIQKDLFWPNKYGDICIAILTLEGEMIPVDMKAGIRSKVDVQPFHFIRRRKPTGSGKYFPCKTGMGVWPYINPGLAQKYRDAERIETLVITEGYFKAYSGYKNGLDIIGIPGIQVWNDKGQQAIFPQISKIIERCGVVNVIWLQDGDALKVEWEEGKDLYKRPNNFFNSVRQFQQKISAHQVNAYYARILEDAPGKGLDDLYIAKPDDTASITKELLRKVGPYEYFDKKDITLFSVRKLRKMFYIDDVNQFYHQYEHKIANARFVYNNGVHYYDEETGELVNEVSGEARRFIRIAGAYYQKGTRPTPRGGSEPVLKKIQKESQFLSEFGARVNPDAYVKKLKRDIPYFHGAINLPAHKNFKEHISTTDKDGNVLRWYNIYRPVNHKPIEGDCPNSIAFIKHIFGEEDIIWQGKPYKSYELGYEYIKILWEKPMQKLPIICLVSELRHTGKSTFWDWQRAIFQQNVRFVRTEHLTGQFTSFFANSLLAVIDEALIEKRAGMERIKALSTAETFTHESKGVDAEECHSYVKIGMTSNNMKNFAIIDEDEIRFWVRQIPKLPDRKAGFLDTLIEEIPAFLFYLESLEYNFKSESRAWFDEGLIETDILKEVKSQSRWTVEKEIEAVLMNYISMSGKAIVKLAAGDIKNMVNNPKHQLMSITTALTDRMKIERTRTSQKYTYYSYDSEHGVISERTKSSMYFTFDALMFFTAEDITEFLSITEIIELEAYVKEQRGINLKEQLQLEWLINIQGLADYIDPNGRLYRGGNTERAEEMWDEYATLHEFYTGFSQWHTPKQLLNDGQDELPF